MRLYSTAALALALAAATGLAMSGPALAKDNDKDKDKKAKEEAKPAAGPPKPQASQAFFKVAKPLQDLLTAKNFDGALAMMPQAESAATTPDDKYFVGSFYANIGFGKSDQTLQRKGIEAMLASGKLSPDLVARYELEAGKFAQIFKEMDAARVHYEKAIAAGNTSSDPLVLLAETYFAESYDNVAGNQLSDKGKGLAAQGLVYLKKATEAEAAAGKPVPPEWFVRGMKMSVLAASPEQLWWSEQSVKHAGTKDNWRLALRALQDVNPNISRDENVDLLRLMRDSDALSNNYSYNEYAEAAWRLGLPGEVIALVDGGVAKAEIKQASFADLYNLAKAAMPKDQASLPASENEAAKAANGRAAANTGNAYLGYGNYAKAVTMYRLALQKGGVDADQVNTRLGIALIRTGDKEGAKAAFAAVTGAPSAVRKAIAELWTIWVEQQA
jgi:hypothetical protein